MKMQKLLFIKIKKDFFKNFNSNFFVILVKKVNEPKVMQLTK